MMTIAVTGLVFSLLAGVEYPELPRKITDETAAEKAKRMAWWRHDRFGMFIHWGLYANYAQGEWYQQQIGMDTATY